MLKLEGGFPFTSADMIELGKAYFERFPDRDQDRNADEVRLGYAVVRAAIIEKAVLAVPPSRRKAYRTLFNDVRETAPAVEALIQSADPRTILDDHDALAAALGGLRASIEEIPKGMIKERYIGGISYFFNIMYVFKLNLSSRRAG